MIKIKAPDLKVKEVRKFNTIDMLDYFDAWLV